MSERAGRMEQETKVGKGGPEHPPLLSPTHSGQSVALPPMSLLISNLCDAFPFFHMRKSKTSSERCSESLVLIPCLLSRHVYSWHLHASKSVPLLQMVSLTNYNRTGDAAQSSLLSHKQANHLLEHASNAPVWWGRRRRTTLHTEKPCHS